MNLLRRLFLNQKNLSVGQIGENHACVFLKKKKYKILARNYSNVSGRRLGEIDIVAKDCDVIVFVEVKTRVGFPGDILPQENITRGKMQKVERIARAYLREKGLLGVPHRFDAVCVWCRPVSHEIVHTEHVESIFFDF
ncbi:MAG: YraN family protein [Candidatus Moranbacteria bacterium]|nr:YraN family protein [Candidatus Moranbacteria bacterium]